MSENPEKENLAAPSAKKDGKKPRAIDLAAGEVKDITPAPEPASDGTAHETVSPEPAPAESPPEAPKDNPPPAPSPSSPKLVPGLIGLVAGVIGGLGAHQFGDQILPRKPAGNDPALVTRLGAIEQRLSTPAGAAPAPAIAARLEKAEAALSEAGKREETLRAEIGKLASALGAESEARRKALDALPRGGAGTPAAPAVTPSEVEGLKSRLGSVETAAKALPETVNALGAQLKSVTPRVEQVAKDVTALSNRMAGLAAQEKLGAAQARLAAATLLEEAFAASRPLGEPVKLLRELGASEQELAALQPYVTAPAPDAALLLRDLRALSPKAQPAPATTSILDRLKAGAASLVEVRKTGTVTGTDDAAHLQRAEIALKGGDIGTAAALVARLSAQNAPVYAAWRARAETRVRAAEAVSAQRKAALAGLAAAAAK